MRRIEGGRKITCCFGTSSFCCAFEKQARRRNIATGHELPATDQKTLSVGGSRGDLGRIRVSLTLRLGFSRPPGVLVGFALGLGFSRAASILVGLALRLGFSRAAGVLVSFALGLGLSRAASIFVGLALRFGFSRAAGVLVSFALGFRLGRDASLIIGLALGFRRGVESTRLPWLG